MDGKTCFKRFFKEKTGKHQKRQIYRWLNHRGLNERPFNPDHRPNPLDTAPGLRPAHLSCMSRSSCSSAPARMWSLHLPPVLRGVFQLFSSLFHLPDWHDLFNSTPLQGSGGTHQTSHVALIPRGNIILVPPRLIRGMGGSEKSEPLDVNPWRPIRLLHYQGMAAGRLPTAFH